VSPSAMPSIETLVDGLDHPEGVAWDPATGALWAGGEDGVSFAGEFHSFENLCSFPKPYQARTLPIHVGGSSSAAARRAGLRGDGYFPGGGINDEQRTAQLALMRESARTAGRDADALEYTRWGNTAMTPDDVAALAAEGVTRVIVSPTTADLAEQKKELSAFAGQHGLG